MKKGGREGGRFRRRVLNLRDFLILEMREDSGEGLGWELGGFATGTDQGGRGGGGGGRRRPRTRAVGAKAWWVARKAGTKLGSCSRSTDTNSHTSRSRCAALSTRTLLVR